MWVEIEALKFISTFQQSNYNNWKISKKLRKNNKYIFGLSFLPRKDWEWKNCRPKIGKMRLKMEKLPTKWRKFPFLSAFYHYQQIQICGSHFVARGKLVSRIQPFSVHVIISTKKMISICLKNFNQFQSFSTNPPPVSTSLVAGFFVLFPFLFRDIFSLFR